MAEGMKPYYQDESVTIYNADCREVLPTLDKVDLVLTDPPYGIGYTSRKHGENETRTGKSTYEGESIVGDDEDFDPTFLLGAGTQLILWGANNYASRLTDSKGWLVWDKKTLPEFYGKTSFSDCEMAWTNVLGRTLIFPHLWNGIVRQGEEAGRRGAGRLHPTQKPVRLMRWCITLADEPKTILDPFMGSGTTLRAAKDLGRKAIGIEIEERYCEIAAKRMSQTVLAL